uniref:phenylalanyl-tRNA synthetase beta chain n=1 Tax=Lithothamnion corallioides TaxID=1277934 RepID=UPI0023F5494B|nr:phenylalanyl-tRNA synthetase beta chain [Lithothamnion corallioides]WEA77101.1 phenylalanyl-tRNA synthetase beta chain [Lithothamnion corallioides]
MKISWNWLSQLVDLKGINQYELAEKLTLAGFEVENIVYKQDIKDTTFDISITANRLDIISLASIAVEIAAILKIPLILYKRIEPYNIEIKRKQLNSLENYIIYTKINLSIIKKVCINNSPKWLQDYLITSDINPTNSILDIIRFVNFKWGQCIKIFQINTNNNIQIETLESLHTEENSEQNRYSEIDITKIQASGFEINSHNIHNYQNANIDIMILGNIYQNNYVNHKKIKSSLKSTRYLSYGYTEAIHLIHEIYTPNLGNKIIYEYENKQTKNQTIKCNINNINRTLGPIHSKGNIKYLDKIAIINILKDLNFTVIDKANELKIKVPEERILDIEKEIDIIEEIGRIYGFNYFSDNLPTINKVGNLSSIKLTTKKIRQVLRSIGLHEVLNYSLRSSLNDNHVQLINPLSNDQKELRTNLIGNLIESKLYNINKVNNDFEAFEIGKIFINHNKSTIASEYLHLAGLLGNSSFCRSEWNKTPSELSWFQAKGTLEEFFERMHIKVSWSENSEKNYLLDNIKQYIHPKRTSYIKQKNKTIGLFSQINSRIAKKLGVLYNIYIFEINIEDLIQEIQQPQHLTYIYKPYSNYPKIIRDISIKVSKYLKMQTIINMIQQDNSKFIESINIFDEYYETETTKSIGLRITYRSKNKTLTNEEVEKIEQMFKNKLCMKLMKSKS